jgi:hypothetical protein
MEGIINVKKSNFMYSNRAYEERGLSSPFPYI